MVAKRYPESPITVPPPDGVMELSFFISRQQFDLLESAAKSANMSIAQYLRRLVQCGLDPNPAIEAAT